MAESLFFGVMERDLNPFFLFDSRGKAIYLNQSAELLLGYANPNVFFALAERYAASNAAFEMRFEIMVFQSFSFYALMSAKENDLFGLRLYHIPAAVSKIGGAETTPANLRAIIDANVAIFRNKSKIEVRTVCDRALAPGRIDQNGFSRLIGKALESFAASDEPLTIALRAQHGGENDAIVGRNRMFIKLVIVGSRRKELFDRQIEEFAASLCACVRLSRDEIILDIPSL
ncbi:MAG: hypothetical protein LBO72_00840 [Helicobacteraceae bacterium]|jgi:ABC-type sugar transport system ATPase subunit|nr:hypothetical protein [Helicobacteraceae bacterium]